MHHSQRVRGTTVVLSVAPDNTKACRSSSMMPRSAPTIIVALSLLPCHTTTSGLITGHAHTALLIHRTSRPVALHVARHATRHALWHTSLWHTTWDTLRHASLGHIGWHTTLSRQGWEGEGKKYDAGYRRHKSRHDSLPL